MSYNERNPCCWLPASSVGNSNKTASANCEEGGDDVKSSRPLRPGLHTCYNGRDREQPLGDQGRIYKPITVRIGVCNSTP